MEKLIGAQIRSGKFTPTGKSEEIEYNNLILFTTSELSGEDDKTFCGSKTNYEAKIQNNPENIAKVFGKQITIEEIRKHLGKPIDIFYDQYKNVARVLMYETDPTAANVNGTVEPPAKGGK